MIPLEKFQRTDIRHAVFHGREPADHETRVMKSVEEQARSLGLNRLRQGKVRDLWQWRDELWLIASDRISAFDQILPTPIPNKGKMLTKLSQFWFRKADWMPNHVISFDLPHGFELPEWEGRLTRGVPCDMVLVECVCRGYLAGSGWAEYKSEGTVGGFSMPSGLKESDRLPEPLFTPAAKNNEGHDENLTAAQTISVLGEAQYETLKGLTIRLYQWAAEYALKRGVIIADTKLEFGYEKKTGKLVLADEVLTPDSSRFWPVEGYEPGRSQPSFDKQYLRDYLKQVWDGIGPVPSLPDEVVAQTQARYQEAIQRLVSEE